MMQADPDYDAALGLINHLPTNDLKELINNEEKLMEMIRDLPQIKNLVNEKEMMLTTNKSLAEYNISLQPKLDQGKQELLAKYEELAILQEKVNSLKEGKNKIVSKQSAEAVQTLLSNAAKEKEEEAENLIQDFLGSTDNQVDTFISTFINEKTIAHARKIKSDNLKELMIENKNSKNSFASSVVTTPWATPYPTQLPNMPLPFQMH